MDFEDLAESVDIAGLLERKPANRRAAARLDGNQAFALQAVQSLAHRRLADAELGSQGFFRQPGAFFQGAFKDVLLDVKVGELGKVWVFWNF